MKLLKDEVIKRKTGLVELTMNPIDTTMQARVIELASSGVTFTAKQQIAKLGLKEILTSLTISGIEYDFEKRVEFADKADLLDNPTNVAYMTIAALIIDETVMDSNIEKKSEPPQKQGHSGGNVLDAPDQLEDENPETDA